jgi:hypothetical protein
MRWDGAAGLPASGEPGFEGGQALADLKGFVNAVVRIIETPVGRPCSTASTRGASWR